MNSQEESSTGPSKLDTDQIFKKLRSLPSNKVCFDCAAKYPTWSSITYGVFICLNCSAVHRSLGVHLSFVRSTLLDTNWTWLQIRQMQLGGNANAQSFFQSHNCSTNDAQEKYTSRAAQLYKEQLHNAAVAANHRYGTKIHIDNTSEDTPAVTEKTDSFFDDHESFGDVGVEFNIAPASLSGNECLSNTGNYDSSEMSPAMADLKNSAEKKLIIGNRKPAPKRTGMGAKNKGFGASKVKTNFADIEREAEMTDKLKVMSKQDKPEVPANIEEEKSTSIRLAYKDLSNKLHEEEEKIKAFDPIKAQQFERLGMGFSNKNGVSHSAMNDMKTIEQEKPSEAEKPAEVDHNDFFELDFSSNSLAMYKNSSENRSLSYLYDPPSFSKSSAPRWKETETKSAVSDSKSKTSPSNNNDEAQKKFGSAKSISSNQFFSHSSDPAWEQKSNLSRFEGSSSISSAEFFGRNEGGQSSTFSNHLPTPDLEDVKESVKMGVTKVAGKLSSLANGVMSSLQEKYGGY